MLDARSGHISSAYRNPHTRRQRRAALTGGVTYQRNPQDPRRRAWSSASPCDRRDPRFLMVLASARPRRPHHPSTSLAVELPRMRSARPAAPCPTARRSSMTRSRLSPSSTPTCSMPCARRRPMPRTKESSSSSTAAGGPRSTRNGCSARRSRVRLRSGSRPLGGHPEHVRSRVGRRGRHRPAATAWLSEHGAAYGLCQIYGNEPWHYELRPDAGE